MSDSTQEIGPVDNSANASIKRFEARQNFNQSTEGKVVSTVRAAEQYMEKASDQEQKNQTKTPDIIERRTILGIPVTETKKWFTKKTATNA